MITSCSTIAVTVVVKFECVTEMAVSPGPTAVTNPLLNVTTLEFADLNLESAVTFFSVTEPSAFVVFSITVNCSVAPALSATLFLSTE